MIFIVKNEHKFRCVGGQSAVVRIPDSSPTSRHVQKSARSSHHESLSHACEIGVASNAELPAGRAEVTLFSAAAVRPSAAGIALVLVPQNWLPR